MKRLELYKKAIEAYYTKSEQVLSDEAFDALEESLLNEGLISESIGMTQIGIDSTKIQRKHKKPMLSLAKAKDLPTIERWYKNTQENGAEGYTVEPKLDGLAIDLSFTNDIPLLTTRGTGIVGEDATYLLYSDDITILGLDLNNGPDRGELMCSKSDLEFNNAQRDENERYPNERVAVAGILQKARLGIGKKTRLSFVSHLQEKSNSASKLFPNNLSKTLKELIDTINLAKDWLDGLDYPTDGVVIKPINSEEIAAKMGSTSHSPRWQLAWKYPSERIRTKIEKIVWQAGRTGRITPVIEIEPVEIDGVLIERASGHNADWCRAMGIGVGAIVDVARANDVIPQIVKVIKSGEDFEEIETCPSCGNRLIIDGKITYCNNEECLPKITGAINTAASRKVLDIDGLSDKTIESLGVKSLSELFALTKSQLSNTVSDKGVKLGQNGVKIYNRIGQVKTTKEEIDWLTALSIPGLSGGTAKKLIEKFGTVSNVLTKNSNDISNIPGIGEITADKIVSYFPSKIKIWNELLELGVKPLKKEKQEFSSDVINFAVTGRIPPEIASNRNEYVKKLESSGKYRFTSSVNKNTDVLITDNPHSGSSKLKNAVKLGVKIMSFEDIKMEG